MGGVRRARGAVAAGRGSGGVSGSARARGGGSKQPVSARAAVGGGCHVTVVAVSGRPGGGKPRVGHVSDLRHLWRAVTSSLSVR